MLARAAAIDAPVGGAGAGQAVLPSGSAVGTLILLRHGESEWNRARRFTGWADVDLTRAGEAEAARAGHALRAAGCVVERCFTSALRRAIRTGDLALRAYGADVVVERSWRLNERHYGALQGLGPWSALRRFGVLPVLRARATYGYRPPALVADSSVPDAAHAEADPAPRSESLADLRARLAPFWHARIAPELAHGRSVLVVSHKHTLRALFAELTRCAGPAPSLRIATGVPIVLTLDRQLAVTARRALEG